MALIRKAAADAAASNAVRLDLGDLEYHAAEVRARAAADAERIIAEAQAERERLIADATETGRTAGHAEGHKKGHAEGTKAGTDKAYAEAKAELAALSQAWREQLDALHASREGLILAAKTDLVRMAIDIAGRVTQRTVETDPSVAAAQAEAAARLIATRTAVVIDVCPDDRESVERALPELVRTVAAIDSAEIAESPALSRGSVIIRTAGGGEIDATLETQLARIAADLVPQQPATQDEPEG